jgi:hypothetical protein
MLMVTSSSGRNLANHGAARPEPTNCADATNIGNIVDFSYNFDSDPAAGVQNNGNLGANHAGQVAYNELVPHLRARSSTVRAADS